MPPRKAAPKQDDNPGELILAYLKAQNRPYSAIDISSNLHNKVTKAKTEKVLKELVKEKVIAWSDKEKANVYWAVQDPTDAATPEQLAAYDSTISSLRDALPVLRGMHNSKLATLHQIRSSMTTEYLREAVEMLEGRKAKLQARLAVLRGGDMKPVTEEEKQMAEETLRYWQRKSVARRRGWLELRGMMEEGMGREELYDKLGIDDEP